MRIAVHDADQTGFPNLALLKLSAWHKAQGDEVGWYDPLFGPYDRIYSSKVFTYTKKDPYLPENAIVGGTGYGLYQDLDNEIEHVCPDYDLYPSQDFSMGFTTRGCIHKCKWCVVPEKEGRVSKHADVDEFVRHKAVRLLDSNILAHSHGIDQLKKLGDLRVKVDCFAGLDARLIDDSVARVMSKVRWYPRIRLACDTKAEMKTLARAVETLRWHNVTPRGYSVLALVTEDVDDAVERVRFIKGLRCDAFAMPYKDEVGTPPSYKQMHFARWVNRRAIYKSVTWEDYWAGKRPKT